MEPDSDSLARQRFTAVMGQVYEPLQRYLLRRTDAATADDVLADTLLVLWRRLSDVPEGAVLPWSYGVARRCLANAARTDERQQRVALRLATERLDEPTEQPFDATDVALDSALGALPDADRELLRLWAWEQLPPRQISQVLGITPNAASIRLHRALSRLRALVDSPYDDSASLARGSAR